MNSELESLRAQNWLLGPSAHRDIEEPLVVRGQLSVASDRELESPKPQTTDNGQRLKGPMI